MSSILQQFNPFTAEGMNGLLQEEAYEWYRKHPLTLHARALEEKRLALLQKSGQTQGLLNHQAAINSTLPSSTSTMLGQPRADGGYHYSSIETGNPYLEPNHHMHQVGAAKPTDTSPRRSSSFDPVPPTTLAQQAAANASRTNLHQNGTNSASRSNLAYPPQQSTTQALHQLVASTIGTASVPHHLSPTTASLLSAMNVTAGTNHMRSPRKQYHLEPSSLTSSHTNSTTSLNNGGVASHSTSPNRLSGAQTYRVNKYNNESVNLANQLERVTKLSSARSDPQQQRRVIEQLLTGPERLLRRQSQEKAKEVTRKKEAKRFQLQQRDSVKMLRQLEQQQQLLRQQQFLFEQQQLLQQQLEYQQLQQSNYPQSFYPAQSPSTAASQPISSRINDSSSTSSFQTPLLAPLQHYPQTQSYQIHGHHHPHPSTSSSTVLLLPTNHSNGPTLTTSPIAPSRPPPPIPQQPPTTLPTSTASPTLVIKPTTTATESRTQPAIVITPESSNSVLKSSAGSTSPLIKSAAPPRTDSPVATISLTISSPDAPQRTIETTPRTATPKSPVLRARESSPAPPQPSASSSTAAVQLSSSSNGSHTTTHATRLRSHHARSESGGSNSSTNTTAPTYHHRPHHSPKTSLELSSAQLESLVDPVQSVQTNSILENTRPWLNYDADHSPHTIHDEAKQIISQMHIPKLTINTGRHARSYSTVQSVIQSQPHHTHSHAHHAPVEKLRTTTPVSSNDHYMVPRPTPVPQPVPLMAAPPPPRSLHQRAISSFATRAKPQTQLARSNGGGPANSTMARKHSFGNGPPQRMDSFNTTNTLNALHTKFANVNALLDSAMADGALVSPTKSHGGNFKLLHAAPTDGRSTGPGSPPSRSVAGHNRHPSNSLASSLVDDEYDNLLAESIPDRLESNRLEVDAEFRRQKEALKKKGPKLSPRPEHDMSYWAQQIHEQLSEERQIAEEAERKRKEEEEKIKAANQPVKRIASFLKRPSQIEETTTSNSSESTK